MNKNEFKMIQLLRELKNKYFVSGIKLEFEAEGTRLEEAIRLKCVTSEAGLPLNIKIGGCEAVRDIIDAEMLGTSRIIAPMVETPYALTKFIDAAKKVLSNHSDYIELLINIETLTAANCFKQMLQEPAAKYLSGIVIGRGDLVSSMNFHRDEVNNDTVLNISKQVAQQAFEHGLDVIVGGRVCAKSIPFLQSFTTGHLTRFETRKVIFSCPEGLDNSLMAFQKADEFELLWLKNKKEHYGRISNEDESRILMLSKRLEQASIVA